MLTLARYLRVETLLRVAMDALCGEQFDHAERCWAELERRDLAEVPGDELQRVYAAAVANGQRTLAEKAHHSLMARLFDARREPLISG